MVFGIPRFFGTKEDAIERLRKEGEKKLYVVTNYVKDKDGHEEELWNIYTKVSDAVRWVALCNAVYSKNPNFEVLSVSNLKVFKKRCHRIWEKQVWYTFTDGTVEQSFVFERV